MLFCISWVLCLKFSSSLLYSILGHFYLNYRENYDRVSCMDSHIGAYGKWKISDTNSIFIEKFDILFTIVLS